LQRLKGERTNAPAIDPHHLRRHGIFLEDSIESEARVAISAYKRLRTQILFEFNSHGSNSFLVTGPTAGVGKTTVSLNLAINLAKLTNLCVMLVDLDLRGSSMQKVLGLNANYGFERIADSDFSYSRASVELKWRNLRVLPCTQRLDNSSELLLSPQAKSFFRTMRDLPKNFLVIYDSPPVLGCDDVLAVTGDVDAVVMVVEEGRTSRKELNDAMETVVNLPIVSTVINKSRDRSIDKYYY